MRIHKLSIQVIISSLFLTAVSAQAEEMIFRTPEDAIVYYIGGINKLDIDEVISSTDVDRRSEKFDYVTYTNRLSTMMPQSMMPATDPFFVEVNKMIGREEVARSIQFFAYGLMYPCEMVDGVQQIIHDGEGTAEEFYAAVQAKRLSEVRIEKIGIPSPKHLNDPRTQANFVNQAKLFGAETSTERLVLLSFGGLHYMVGFHLLRYGDDWLIDHQTSFFVPTGFSGAPKQVTVDEYEKNLQ